MISLPLAQAKKQLCELITRVETGETVSVTRRGRPVAHLVRCSDDQAGKLGQQVQRAFSRLRQLRKGVCLEGDVRAISREGLE